MGGGYGCCVVIAVITIYQHMHAACLAGFEDTLRGSSSLHHTLCIRSLIAELHK